MQEHFNHFRVATVAAAVTTAVGIVATVATVEAAIVSVAVAITIELATTVKGRSMIIRVTK